MMKVNLMYKRKCIVINCVTKGQMEFAGVRICQYVSKHAQELCHRLWLLYPIATLRQGSRAHDSVVHRSAAEK